MKKFLLGVCLLLSATLALAQMPEKTWQEALLAIQQGNYEQAVRLLRPWAERGDAWAQYSLGVMYYRGRGVAQDYAKAREWWEKAAAQGDVNAQFSLGLMYEYGQGVEQSDFKARDWWKKAAAQGDAEAQNKLGVMYYYARSAVRDWEKACEWWEKAAAQGFAEAQSNLGMMYYHGRGVAQSDAKARGWLEKAAAQTEETRQKLTQAIEQGNDDVQAVQWLQPWANRDNAWAQSLLGLMYKNGASNRVTARRANGWKKPLRREMPRRSTTLV